MKLFQRPDQPESGVVVIALNVILEAGIHPNMVRRLVPGPPTKHSFGAIALPAAVRPLPDIARHVVQAKAVWLKATHW